MKSIKKLLSFIPCAIMCTFLSAQLSDGSIAPDWDITDLEDEDHSLEDYLDNGKHVIIDFAATWCFHCYNFHQSGTLESLYEDFGPDGSDDLMVFMFEGDEDTNDACLYGDINNCSDATQGNFVFGTEYPIANLEGSELDIVSDYNISSWPTIYLINADHQTVWEVGQSSLGTWENWITESFTLDIDFLEVTPGPCELGEISATASGGYGDLSYTWSNGESGQNVIVESGSYDLTIEDDLGYFIVLEDIEIENDQLPFLIDDVEIIDVDCHGDDSGSIFIDIDSNDDLDFIWSNGDDSNFNANLESGTYYLTVVNNDNGCDIELEYEVEEPEEINVEFDASDTSCGNHNGSIEIFVDGGVGDLYYDYGDGFVPENEVQNLAPGNYIVSIEDENECQVEIEIEIASSDILMTEIQVANGLNCTNSEILVEATVNSLNPITYTWTNSSGEIIYSSGESSILINEAGSYAVQAVDQVLGCISNSTFLITENYDLPAIEIKGIQNLDCETSSLLLNLIVDDTLGNYISTWSYVDHNGDLIEIEALEIEIVEPGSYDVSVLNTANGCSVIESFEIGYTDNTPIAAFDFLLDVNELNLESNSIGLNLLEEWTVDGALVTPDQDGNIFFEENGVYEVCLTVTNECGVNSSCVTIEVTDIVSGIDELSDKGFNIYSTGNKLVINSAHSGFQNSFIRVLDRNGKLVETLELNIQKGINTATLSVFNTGIYIVNIQTPIGEKTLKTFISN